MRALIQLLSNPASISELAAVCSQDESSKILQHAADSGIPAHLIRKQSSAALPKNADVVQVREQLASAAAEFSEGLQRVLSESNAQQLLILSDVDTSLLSRDFLEAWIGNVLLVHDSLLPAFPEAGPIEAALSHGVCITGCTVCFALPPDSGLYGACHGPIIMQESTCVLPGDTVASLHDRIVSECECKVLPTAMQLVADGSVALNKKGTRERSASYIKDSGDEMSVENIVSPCPTPTKMLVKNNSL